MKLEKLTKDEIKEILKQLLQKVEVDKNLVARSMQINEVYLYNGRYCVNFYNGFEHKVCSINEENADISSEDATTNKELTIYYKKILKSLTQNKKQEVAI